MTMFYCTITNQYVTEGTAFELGGTQFPANWLNSASQEDKASFGLVEVTVVGEKKDDRYYWNSETLSGATLTYTSTPKDLDGLKVTAAAQVRDTAYALLAPSDWRVIRGLEIGQKEPTDWTIYREAVRTKSNEVHAAIDASATVDELIAAVTDIAWPNDPNYVAPEVAPEVLPE